MAALLLLFAPSSVSAAAPQEPAFPAIASAIPVEPAASGIEIPAYGRAVLIDASSARLFMIEDGRVWDSMRVIVGKPTAATPSLTSMLQSATLNPYWNVPTDLARTLIAPRVMKEGPSYLRERGYQIVTDFEDNARVLAAESVDWEAVAAGRTKVFVRQLPGPANSMGQVKFGLARNDGIFLHDTPRKELFEDAQRNISNGCIRLEDASRFAYWLLGRDFAFDGSAPEQHVWLSSPVPIVITYLGGPGGLQAAASR